MIKYIVLIQIGDLNNLNYIFEKLNIFNNNENFFLISIMNKYKHSEIAIPFTNYHIMFHENKGMDIGPYLLQLLWIFENKNINDYDYIYKVHTKTNFIWLKELLENHETLSNNIIGNKKWYLPLEGKLNKKHILSICEQFNIDNIYYDSHYEKHYNETIDLSFYSYYYNVPLNYDDLNYEFVKNHSIINDYVCNETLLKERFRKHNISFMAGSIFIIKYNTVWSKFKHVLIKDLYNLLEENYTINNESTYVHAIERIISSF